MKLYLDIDGVLLTAKNPQAAEGAAEFVEFITDHFDCYWLTTHCQGNTDTALRYLSDYFDDATMERLQSIKPTRWETLKTDGIDFNSRFVWIDDYAMQAEKTVLKQHDASDSLILVDLYGINNLKTIMKRLLNLTLFSNEPRQQTSVYKSKQDVHIK